MITFTYTKKNKDVSNRVGLVASSPNKNFGIIDISDLDTPEQLTIDKLYKEYINERDELIANLNAKYNLTHLLKDNFKNFSPEGMSNIEVF